MPKKYAIETHGCQMNFRDSECLAGLLEQAGYEAAAVASEADVIVLNTCSVRERAQLKLYSRVGELRTVFGQPGRQPLIAVTGCVAQQEGPRILSRCPSVSVVAGPQAARRLPALLDRALATHMRVVDTDRSAASVPPAATVPRLDSVRAFVTISEGCNDCCSFCVVPLTRGRERMRPKHEILTEAAQAAICGRREIVLLGQLVNHYQAPDDPACDFAAMLEAVAAVPGVDRVRFASPHPRFVSPRLIATMRDTPGVCKHLHLPVQSGSSRILSAMRRRHTREEYLDLVAEVRRLIPGITLSTDMIVGFPGETAEDFEQTLSLVSAVQYQSMFSFKYSARPNTFAGNRLQDDVPDGEKARRLQRLQQLQREIQTRLHDGMVGSVVDILVDSQSRRKPDDVSGRTSGNVVVNVPGPASLLGSMIRVRIDRAGPNSLWGQMVGPPT